MSRAIAIIPDHLDSRSGGSRERTILPALSSIRSGCVEDGSQLI